MPRFERACAAVLMTAVCVWSSSVMADVEVVGSVEKQPFEAATARLVQALQMVGAPLAQAELDRLKEAAKIQEGPKSVRAAQAVLDPHVLAVVKINPESRVSVVEGPAQKELLQQGWRAFLVKVINEAGSTPELKIDSPNSLPAHMTGPGKRERPTQDAKLVTPEEVPARFLEIDVLKKQPLKPALSGLEVEYRVIQLFCRDSGKREALLQFSVGPGTQDLGFRGEVPILFTSKTSTPVRLRVLDDDGKPTTGSFTIRDKQGRIYPHPGRRMAPDFFFQDQVYRRDGETVILPPGHYTLVAGRGPEYLLTTKEFDVVDGQPAPEVAVRLTRWVHPKARGWFSGDHHVHAAGCKHYDSPTEGVRPEDMIRHIDGEDLNVGCVLAWGPCWYAQKQFFEGKTSDLAAPDSIMRYDVEVSGFPSSHAGHVCLLNLKEDDYPGTKVIEDWPSWTLPVLAWAKSQGGVVGYAHSGNGLLLPDIMPDGSREFPKRGILGPESGWAGKAPRTLPDDAMPKFDGIGANETIVTAPLGACDFISTVDTQPVWELNLWYHMLNSGVTTRISGESDFPCIFGKIGVGRVYVSLPKGTPLTYEPWIEGVRDGRSYCSDGMSHVFDFRLENGKDTVQLGERRGDKVSRMDLAKPGTVTAQFDVAAWLKEKPDAESNAIRKSRIDSRSGWSIEHARIGDSRKVPVEVIVNGNPVKTIEIAADGTTSKYSVDLDIKKSSWVAVRVFPSVHTNPIWVQVNDQPVRARKRSAEWCREAVEVCWKSKMPRIREGERAAARAAYDEAAKYYDKAIVESVE